VLYLGDSVARQVYPQGRVSDSIKSLTTNQAISVEGQYYLLRDALSTHRDVTDVVLMYSPPSWANNLDQVFTTDYFCGYFHRPGEIEEAFEETRNWSFLFAHVRWALLPNLSAANSWVNQSAVELGPPLTRASAQGEPVPISKVSSDYLKRMRMFAVEHGVRLHVYSTPVSDQYTFRDDDHIYDEPILYLPHNMFLPDTIHLLPAYIDLARGAMARHIPSSSVLQAKTRG